MNKVFRNLAFVGLAVGLVAAAPRLGKLPSKTPLLKVRATQSLINDPSFDSIAADSCGGVKLVSSTEAVTGDTTNTIANPGSKGKGCIMDIVNAGSFDLLLDDNALFHSTGTAHTTLGSSDTIRVIYTGSFWVTASFEDLP